MFVDTHCHLHDQKFNDLDSVVKAYTDDGVDMVIDMGCDYESSLIGKDLSEKYSSVYFGCGFHPSDAYKFTDRDIDKLLSLSKNPKCVAIGEIGLDYYWEPFDKKVQQSVFIKQLEVAYNAKLPVSIHSREATFDMLNLLKEHRSLLAYGAVMHCYSGSVETARELMNLGVMIGFGGTVTFKNARKLLEVAEFVPTEYMLTETDSPYLAPHPYRGKRNEPKYVSIVTSFLADLKKEELTCFSGRMF